MIEANVLYDILDEIADKEMTLRHPVDGKASHDHCHVCIV